MAFGKAVEKTVVSGLLKNIDHKRSWFAINVRVALCHAVYSPYRGTEEEHVEFLFIRVSQ